VFPVGTKTSADAAAAAGCELSAIAKCIIFMADDEPVGVLMSGDKRIDTVKLSSLRDARVRVAGLDEVRHHTGYAAGGTPPFGHRHPVAMYIDPHLRRHDQVWIACGTPTTVCPIDRETLVAVTGAQWADLAEGS
jgi:prolyl-tRNA editing enzyme YbaK/EbsC (Cys-tRNA(Pro) deacylase)